MTSGFLTNKLFVRVTDVHWDNDADIGFSFHISKFEEVKFDCQNITLNIVNFCKFSKIENTNSEGFRKFTKWMQRLFR